MGSEVITAAVASAVSEHRHLFPFFSHSEGKGEKVGHHNYVGIG
jgi:hypothetical protein